MIKILLINSNTESKPYPVLPLGLCLLASYLLNKNKVITDTNKQYQPYIFDPCSTPKTLATVISEIKPDYIGLGIRNVDDLLSTGKYFIPEIMKNYISAIRENSNSPLILGGSGFSIYPGQLMKEFNADYGIIGEGEESFEKLISYIEKNQNHPIPLSTAISIDNVITSADIKKYGWKIFSINNTTIKTGKNRGKLIIPYSNMGNHISLQPYREKTSYSIQTKRGCVYECIYCSYPVLEGNSYRLRNVVDVVDEIENTHKHHGITSFEFVDSTFNSPIGHAEEICKEIIARNLKLRFRTMGVNPANVTKELITLMQLAGFTQIDCTPDTASESMLKNMKKNFILKNLIDASQIFKQCNMPVMWFFILGGPGETEGTVMESLDFISKYIEPLDMVHITKKIRIFPGTEIHNTAINEKLISPDDDILKPAFYLSPHISEGRLSELVNSFIKGHPNCVLAEETEPSPEMIKEAFSLKKEMNIDEPMFRTLLRIRKAKMR